MVRTESWGLTPALSDVDFLVIEGRGGLNSRLMVGDEQEEGFAGVPFVRCGVIAG